MNFKKLTLGMEYNTDDNDIVKEFYNPVLKETFLYRRAVGFFNSSSLLEILVGIKGLIMNNGKIELLISPFIEEKDLEYIDIGYRDRFQKIEKRIADSIDITSEEQANKYNLLAWLISEQYLDIKIVLRNNSNSGLFHQKTGLLYDGLGNKIVFTGSNNETRQAMNNNYETFSVYYSWEGRESLRIENHEKKFKEFWNNENENWRAEYISEDLKTEILKYKLNENLIERIKNGENGEKNICREGFSTYIDETIPKVPDNIDIRDYQKEAINNWYSNDLQGIFEMATGTGKTFTSLIGITNLIERYIENNIGIGLVIVVPYKVLLEQWDEDLKKFGIDTILCYDSYKKWTEEVDRKISMCNSKRIKYFSILTTNRTFMSERFQNKLKMIKVNYTLCIDEVHNFLSETSRRSLPDNATFRLGLSATLESEYRQRDIERLKEYFVNGIIYKYSMEEAIKNNFLTEYKYYPVFVELTDEEKIEYIALSKQIAKLVAIENSEDNESLKNLFNKRSKLISSADKKIEKLYEFKNEIKEMHKVLFYCGDKIDGGERYIDRVTKVLGKDIGIKVHTFTSMENKADRENLLLKFRNNDLQALTAIKCLDEGVDIPDLRTAFILSSGKNKKEFIQRRGRVLRKSEGKKYAVIYDFIVVPTLNESEIKTMNENLVNIEKKILLLELDRFYEFADLSLNVAEAYKKLDLVINMYR